jgi:hypothetical protein
MDQNAQPKKKGGLWWKILLGIVIFIVLVIILAMWATSDLVTVAEKQLTYLKSGDYIAAYGLTSKDFQANTTLDQFKAFVAQYPGLSKNISHDFSERAIENDLGTLSGTVTSVEGGVTPIAYQFVKENGEWRILGIKLNQSGATTQPVTPEPSVVTPAPATAATLAKVLISDVADANGSVETGKATFAAATPELAVSAYILKAAAGLKVTAVMTYLPTGDKVGPVTNDTETAGDIISNFSFSKPTAGWPSGEYSVNVSLSDGQTMTINFNIP